MDEDEDDTDDVVPAGRRLLVLCFHGQEEDIINDITIAFRLILY